MRKARRWLAGGAAGVGLGCVGLAGCQTYPAGMGGMTLPSPHYLKHYPQYFTPEQAFPLQRELDSMMDPEGLGRPGVVAAPTPVAPLPPPGMIAPPAPAGGGGGMNPPPQAGGGGGVNPAAPPANPGM
jgi:hypothetical protein